jgi:integrase
MAYYVNGKQVRQSTKEIDEKRARQVLRRRIAEVLRGEVIPHERRVTLGDLVEGLKTNYVVNRRRSLKTIDYPLRHIVDHFSEAARAVAITTDRLDGYIAERLRQGAAPASIRIELALLSKAFTLAVRAKRLRSKPFIPKPEGDPSRVRHGFFARDEVEALCQHIDSDLADLVRFLFFSTWRVGEVRTLEWRDYHRGERTIRLRAEYSKTKHSRVLPIEGELARVMERRLQNRRLHCPYIFHREGKPIGDFRKTWHRACAVIGLTGRIVHDLRRSGIKHLINSGVDPHTVMRFSGHRTDSMLRRYHIVDLDDLRRAAEQASAYSGRASEVVPLADRKRRERAE